MTSVNCLEFRRALGADPTHASADSLAHRAACTACEKYAQDMLRMNGLIKQALQIPVPTIGEFIVPTADVTTLPAPRRFATRRYAMAASLFLMIGFVATIAWLSFPRESLAKDAVAHLKHEIEAMRIDNNRVAANLLDGMLRAKGWHLTQKLDDVSYLQNCEFRGQAVPHLVIQTERGPVTVLLLPQEKVKKTQTFTEGPYHGMLAPLHAGSVAIISEDERVLQTVSDKVHAAVAAD